MPISSEEFEHLGDHKGLSNLHVYGNLLELYSLPINATIARAGNLFRELEVLETRMLTLYASYVLAHSGFYVEEWTSEDWIADLGEALYTTKFKDVDWIENMDIFEPLEESGFQFEWEMLYRNERCEKLKLIFVNLICVEMSNDNEVSEVIHYAKLLDNKCSNYLIAHPRLTRQSTQTFKGTKKKIEQAFGKDIFLSTGEFVSKIIPDEQKRHIIEENWNSLREKIVENLQKKWPLLIYSTYTQQLSDVEEQIRKSKVKYETYEFADSIKDAGVACESLLQILHSVYVSKKNARNLEFYDLLCAMKDILTEKFGTNIYQDLDFIRKWRNNVVHPGREKPDSATALQVMTKANLFNELFKKKIFQRIR